MLVNSSTVAMGNGAHCKITGMGNIIMKMFDGVVRTLSNVRHVLDIEKNLISLGTLDSNGFGYKSEGGIR
jgi:transcriptional/translational regulatory protein YebC/TACO1